MERDPLRYTAYMEHAKILSAQMQFTSAAEVLRKQVLAPIVCQLDSQKTSGFYRFVKYFWRSGETEVEQLFKILCESFAQLSQVHVVSAVDFVFDPNNGKLLQEIVENAHVRDMLRNGGGDVTARLRFVGACTQVVFERFHREDQYPHSYSYTPEVAQLIDSSGDMTMLVCDIAKQMKCIHILKKIRYDVALLKTLAILLRYQRKKFYLHDIEGKTRQLPIEDILEVWQYWKEIKFPEIHLEWIACLALIAVREHKRKVRDEVWSRETNLEDFYSDLGSVIVRSMDCGVHVLCRECFRIVIEMIAKHSKAVNVQRFAAPIFAKVLTKLKINNGIKFVLLFPLLDIHSNEIPKCPQANRLFRKFADKMCIVNKRAHIRYKDLYTYMHKMSYKLVLISDEWQDIDLMIETLEKFSTSLESFDQQMLGHLGLAYLVKGKQLVKEGNDTEAEEWFTKAERTFSRAKDVPESQVYGKGIFQLMHGIFLFDRGNLEGAVGQLTSSLDSSACEQFCLGCNLLSSLLPREFRTETKAYFDSVEIHDNDIRGMEYFDHRPDFKIRLEVIVRFLLVTCQKELGHKVDAKRSAINLHDAVRAGFQQLTSCYNNTILSVIIRISYIDEDRYKMHTSGRLKRRLEYVDAECRSKEIGPFDSEWMVSNDEKSVDEIRFEYTVARNLFQYVYQYDVTVRRLCCYQHNLCRMTFSWLLPRREEICAGSKKAMYYSISGHAFALLGCVDEARAAFTRAKKCGYKFPTCGKNLRMVEMLNWKTN